MEALQATAPQAASQTARPIGDYAIIGDCRSAALISSAGSIDWLCLPDFASPSVFAALLDPRRGGRFQIQPVSPYRVDRRYVGHSNVLETTFRTRTGTLRLVDCMPVTPERDKRRRLTPFREVLRQVECLDGEVEVEVRYEPRPDYGRHMPRLRDRGMLGLACQRGAELLLLQSEIPLAIMDDRAGALGRVRMRAGERRCLSLGYCKGEPAVLAPLGQQAASRLAASTAWWHAWAQRCPYQGPYRDAVLRSLLTLKLMTFAPSGAVVAAPTTSLPETIGGQRNWDYRYCWIRDASLTLQSLLDLGYTKEGQAFLSWLLHTTRITRPQINALYDVFGEARIQEHVLEHLDGYRGSRPVRVGNRAANQLQLDTYGEVLHAVDQYIQRGGRIDRTTGRLLVGFGKAVCRRWREPDQGIWELRSERRHNTFSKVMCWVALECLRRLHEQGHVQAPVARFTAERDAIRDHIEQRGYNPALNSYVSRLDGDDVDASLLLLPRYGYVAYTSPRMLGTTALIARRLRRGKLVYRYRDLDDGLTPGEGAFGICSFWYVSCRARQGAVDEACADFEYLLSLANDLGLFAEEIEPDSAAALGNYPQAFTHVGLIDAALTLAECRGQRATGELPAKETL